MIDDQRTLRFAIGCFVAVSLLSLATCTALNPDYRPRLESLSLSPGSLAPVFDSKTATYSVDVDNTVSEVTVTATLRDTDESMTVNGLETSSGQAQTISLNAHELSIPIPIVVTAPNENQTTYTVTVNRPALMGTEKLQSLSVAPGALAPAFDPSVATYSVDVASAVGEVTVTATFQDSNASMTVNGLETSSGQTRTISLQGPGVSTPIPVVVTAPNGSRNSYAVTVNRAALSGNNKVQSLSVSPGSLSPPFSPSIANYFVTVPAVVASITITAFPDDPVATVFINNQTTTTLPVQLQLGVTTRIQIMVVAQNGATNPYAVEVQRAFF